MNLETENGDVVIVEPICRGSRLDSLSLIVKTFSGTKNVHLITRADYQSEHYEEMLGGVDGLHVHPIQSDLDGEWIKALTKNELAQIVAKLIALDAQRKSGYTLIFTALDEYMVAMALRRKTKLHNVRNVYFAKYRISYLLRRRNVKDVLLSWLTRRVITKWGGGLISFDDRLRGKLIAGKEVLSLPDPWIGGFSPNLRTEARNRFKVSDDFWAIVAIGRQVERKGIGLVIKTLPEIFTSIPQAHFYLFGKIDECFCDEWEELLKQWNSRITQVEEFFPQEMMPYVYALADVILLPYLKGHDATSGILPRASASGVPVVTSDHGAIGEIVRDKQIGECFESGDSNGFLEALSKVKVTHTYPGIMDYASLCSPSTFMNDLSEALGHDAM